MPRHPHRCLLLALISLPLNDPRRQGIGIYTSSQMGCLHDNSLCTFILYIHYRFNHVTYLHASSSRKVEHWFIKTMSHLCIGTCLLEPNVATPLHVLVSISILVYFFERVLCFSSSHLNFNPIYSKAIPKSYKFYDRHHDLDYRCEISISQ